MELKQSKKNKSPIMCIFSWYKSNTKYWLLYCVNDSNVFILYIFYWYKFVM